MRIAVDLLGGDHAPGEILLGVADALRADFSPDDFLLIGPKEITDFFFKEQGIPDIPEIIHTDVFIAGDEKPIVALRAKPKASISLAVKAMKDGKAQGLVAMGNTGAAVAASTMGLGMLKGIRRPAIAVTFRMAENSFILLDAGANPTPKPLHLFQYGLMGESFARDIFDQDRPRVALLNIGSEASKGSPLLQETHQLFSDSDFNFVGNIEGNHLFSGEADVIVADGFSGNLALKVIEGFAEFLGQAARNLSDDDKNLRASFRSLLGAADYSEVGGAILLGVNATVIIGHGRSRANAVLSAIRFVREELQKGVNQHILQSAAAYSEPAQSSHD